MRVCRPWTAEDDAYLAANYATAPLWQMSKHLGRTVAALKRRAQALQIRRENHSTKGMKFPNRKRPQGAAVRQPQQHTNKVDPLHSIFVSWAR